MKESAKILLIIISGLSLLVVASGSWQARANDRPSAEFSNFLALVHKRNDGQPSLTPGASYTPVPPATVTNTATATSSLSPTASPSPTITPTPSNTPTPTQTHTPNPNGTPETFFVDVAADVGLTLNHDFEPLCNPHVATGAAWADFDNDGDIDAFVTNHSGPNYFYENIGDTDADNLPNFNEIASTLGLDDPNGLAHGTVFIDYDNDGDQDLYVMNLDENNLYQNQKVESGTATFTDVSVSAFSGVGDYGRGVTGTWGDYDGDGFLDLYVARHNRCVGQPPFGQDNLFHNNGDGTFSDVTALLCAGVAVSECSLVNRQTFVGGWVDIDNDVDPDIYLIVDAGNGNPGNVLWRNDGPGCGGWCFTDISAGSGADHSVDGMGLGVGDYNNDGWLDLAFSDVGPAWLLSNNGDETFYDASVSSGFAGGTGQITWGTVFFDENNDGHLDAYLSNGAISFDGGTTPNFYLRNDGDATFTNWSSQSGANSSSRGRHVSIVDFDLDGFVDLFVGNLNSAPHLYHNENIARGNTNHWLTVTLEGTVSNRDAIGSRLWLSAGGYTRTWELSSGPTYGGGDYKAAYFGLGTSTSADLTIRWPTGLVEHIGTVSADQQLHLVEPNMTPTATPVPTNTPVFRGPVESAGPGLLQLFFEFWIGLFRR
jgi:hypothetical protein